jgi:hypothetical protein
MMTTYKKTGRTGALFLFAFSVNYAQDFTKIKLSGSGDAGFQVAKAFCWNCSIMISIAASGIFDKGLTQGIPRKLEYSFLEHKFIQYAFASMPFSLLLRFQFPNYIDAQREFSVYSRFQFPNIFVTITCCEQGYF